MDQLAFAREEDGIVFQTCLDHTRGLLVHYEPDQPGNGYGYQYIAWPVDARDGISAETIG